MSEWRRSIIIIINVILALILFMMYYINGLYAPRKVVIQEQKPLTAEQLAAREEKVKLIKKDKKLTAKQEHLKKPKRKTIGREEYMFCQKLKEVELQISMDRILGMSYTYIDSKVPKNWGAYAFGTFQSYMYESFSSVPDSNVQMTIVNRYFNSCIKHYSRRF